MPRVINFSIISHPINWLTVLLMVLIAGIAIHLILDWLPTVPFSATKQTTS